MSDDFRNLTGSAPLLLAVAAVIFILSCGGAYVWRQVKNTDWEFRRDLLRRTRLIAEGIDSGLLVQLGGTGKDLSKAEYRQLKDQLVTLRKTNTDLRFIYLMGIRPGGEVFFFADSEPDGSPEYIPPGSAYDEIPPSLRRGMEEKVEIIDGPLVDRWGKWVSALIPLHDPATGDFVAGLGADIDASIRVRSVVLSALPGVITTLMMIIIALAGIRLLVRRSRSGSEIPKWMTYIEPGMVTAFGISLTLLLVWHFYQREHRECQETFYILAQEETRNFVSSTKLLQTKLEALAKFVSTTETLTEEKFQYYCQAFSDNILVWGWNWIPEVGEAARSRFVAAARAGGMTGYEIWERDSTGGRRASPKRAVYYPILYAAPVETAADSVGFDLASELRRKTAVERALVTGLAIASDPIPLLFDNSGVIGFLVIHPMVRPNSKIPTGAVAAAIRGDALYRSYSNARDILHTTIFLYNAAGRPQRLAVNGRDGRRNVLAEETPFIRPVLAFGKVFILNVKPGFGYKHSCSTLTSLGIIALTGVAFTVAIAMIVALICRRRTELQRLVKERTLKLNESEKRFAVLAKDSRTVLWESDARGFYTYISPVCRDVYGYAPEELLNRKRYYDLHPAEGREQFIEEIRRMVSAKQHFIDFIHPVETRSGDILMVSGNSVPILDEDGALIGYHGFDKDVTERERINQELRDSKQAAEAASQAKTEFLAHMSHEIRTPLNGVIGMTDLLRESGLDADQRHFVEIIGSNGKLLLSVVNDILDFSQIEEGKVKLDPLDFNLDDFVSELSGSLAYQARQKGLELVLSISLDAPSIINGDSLRLRQVIINLANNAIKFTEKGEVRISVTVECETENSVLLRFRVKDTGIGISKKQMPYLFDPFFQGDSSVKRKYGGTGLGLPISKRLVECMGGAMTFVSQQGVGSEFTFTVPFGTRACINTASALYDHWHDVRVLVLDDHAAWREILSGYLSALSLRPAVAGDSVSAIGLLRQAAAERDPFRLVLVDCGISSPEIGNLTRAVEAEPDADRPLLLALLPIGRRLEETEGQWAGIINKPFSRKDLINRIGKLSQPEPRPVLPPAAAVAAPPAPAGPARAVPGSGGAADILLVEDNRTNQMVAQLMLKKLGLQIEIAGNGHDALKLLAVKTYKAVLMDVQMPGMDGLEATRRIRADESPVLNRRIPVIAMTAHALSEYQEMCSEAGMDDYITKPFTVNQFHKVLSRWIQLGELPVS